MSYAARLPILATLLISSSAFAQPYLTLRTADPDGEVRFGSQVALSADWTIVAGGGWPDVQAFVFERQSTGSWIEMGKLPTDSTVVDMALDGPRAIIGAGGSATIFDREASGAWVEAARLEVGQPFESWRERVSLSGNRAVVCCTSNDDATVHRGYVFERDEAGAWVEASTLEFSDNEWIGPIAIDGDQALVGNWKREVEDGVGAGGAVHVFDRNPSGDWIETAVLEAGDKPLPNWFGWSLSISGGRAIVGDPEANPQAIFDVHGPGAAYVFERNGAGDWVEVAELRAEDARFGFGQSVSISGDRAIVGEGFSSDAGAIPGATYVFGRDESGAWVEVARMTWEEVRPWEIGWAVAIDGDRAVVGAPFQSGVGAEEQGKGAALLFDLTSFDTASATTEVPAESSLFQNYPNPFNPGTSISYQLHRASDVSLTVYDVMGREVQRLASGTQAPGVHEVSFDASDQPSGIYFYTLTAGEHSETRKMVLLR